MNKSDEYRQLWVAIVCIILLIWVALMSNVLIRHCLKSPTEFYLMSFLVNVQIGVILHKLIKHVLVTLWGMYESKKKDLF